MNPFSPALLLTVAVIAACAAPPPEYSIDGPPAPSREASIAVTEAAVRSAIGGAAKRPDWHMVIRLKTDLTGADYISLLERLSDLPVTFTSYEDTGGTKWGDILGRVKVEGAWLENDRVDVRVYSEVEFSYRIYILHGRQRDGKWNFTSEPTGPMIN